MLLLLLLVSSLDMIDEVSVKAGWDYESATYMENSTAGMSGFKHSSSASQTVVLQTEPLCLSHPLPINTTISFYSSFTYTTATQHHPSFPGQPQLVTHLLSEIMTGVVGVVDE